MPWSETTAMDERLQFVAGLRRGTEEMAVLCRRYGVSRKTGYKRRDRYAAAGAAGLAERLHAVHHCPHATGPDAVEALCELRRRHPTWGPKKLLAVLRRTKTVADRCTARNGPARALPDHRMPPPTVGPHHRSRHRVRSPTRPRRAATRRGTHRDPQATPGDRRAVRRPAANVEATLSGTPAWTQ